MKNVKLYILALFLISFFGCKKSNFLDKKPSTNILQPVSLTDFQLLLDNTLVFNYSGALVQMGSDEYETSYVDWQARTATERNSYIWEKDLYGGDVNIADWNTLYQQVFYANSVLDGLMKSDSSTTSQGLYIKGWALFNRAYAFYDLTRSFCKAYDSSTASSDLGIPLRLTSDINYAKGRSSLQETLNQIIVDLSNAVGYLPSTRPSANLNRPSKIAVYALLARIYLDMRNYVEAEKNADLCMNLYSKIIDYNTVSKISSTPFSTTNDELIYNSQMNPYGLVVNSVSSPSQIPIALISLYPANDLRLTLYYANLNGRYTRKRGYYGAGAYPFTGLATDEIYLIKAECLARRGQIAPSMSLLDQLVSKRWDPNATSPLIVPYQNLVASDKNDAINKVLLERRKELVWRGTRWPDIKRLNKEGGNITLTRILNGQTYSIQPNSPRYVFPIPSDEIVRSGIQQN